QELFITGLEVSGVVKNIAVPVDRTDTIIFDKGENNFHLTFSASDFVSSDKTLFRYRLSDINRSWIETDHHNRNINYSNLKPGWYTLDIQATNKNGEWSAAKKITIRINPYFYQTGFFLLLLFLLILAVLIASVSLYIRDMKQKERLKHDELKLQSLRGQMNPHFIFNSLNSINYFISNNDRLSANRYIADFSRLVRTILSSLGNNYIPFETEVGSLRDYLNIEHLRFGDKFDFELKTEEIGDYNRTEVLPGLVQPFVENAIWHGVRALENRKGIIRIRFLPTNNDRIKCIVEDDGIGRRNSDERHKQADRHQSRGIDIVIERLQLISKIRGVSYDLEIDDLYPEKSETGTRVKIDLPVK
ncbi:MAG: histidine kinase, partial [Bacteroidales bacterium]|nr:histidine kinase [Bacteroidales bacterium]